MEVKYCLMYSILVFYSDVTKILEWMDRMIKKPKEETLLGCGRRRREWGILLLTT